MQPAARLTLALLVVLAASCSRSARSTAPSSSPGPPRTVTGFITEIEFGKLSLRAVDGRSLIFSLTDSPMPVADLRRSMIDRSPIRITYRASPGTLVMLKVEEPCPGPECPPPYSQPAPSGL